MAAPQRGIVTPEGVVLEFEAAGIASRALARVIDALLQALGLLAVALLAVALPGSAGVVGAIVGVAIVVLGYPAGCEILMRGRSPGKAALGLRVVTSEGAPIAPRHAFIRSVLGVIDFLLLPGGLIAVASTLLTARSQRFGDLVAGTIVLRERSAAAPAMAVWFHPPPGLEAYAASLDVGVVTDPQFAVVRSFLLRVHELVPEARAQLALRIAEPLSERLGERPPPNVSPELFLVCVAAAHQRRAGIVPPPPPPAWVPPPPPPPPPVPAPGATA